MDPEKTIFVNWDESAINEKPLGCVGENRPFLFSRDLALIYTALNIPASELDIQEICPFTFIFFNYFFNNSFINYLCAN
uniref:Uncharacterized protein n=1 Tax=Meloidogyne incognita TaxID=6306 RepID=A0A914MBM4_MELIC